MAIEDLRPFNKIDPEEARKIQQKGGIASGVARRKRKALRDSMNALLDSPILDTKKIAQLKKLGIDAKDLDNSQLVVAALFKRACLGDVYAIRELRDLIGEADSGKDNGSFEQLVEALKDV